MENGQILLHDKAFSQIDPNTIKTVSKLLKSAGVQVRVKNQGNIISQIRDIGREFIIPNDVFSRQELVKDKRLLILSLIGLAPAFLVRFSLTPYITFYAIALYFATNWGLFFFYLFKTKQVTSRTTILIFFLPQAVVFILFDTLRLPEWPLISLFYSMIDSEIWILKLIGFIFGVGICEEFVKAIPLIIVLYWAREPIIPQIMVFYGLISGIAFGVFEGVQYQTTLNTQLGYSDAFFMNITRLTSLPFLHAIWAGIAGYFISFAALYPKYRISLFSLAIATPAVIHGLYNTLGWSFSGLILTILSVILLMSYLRQGVNYQSKLSK